MSGKWAPGCILVTSDRLLVARSQGVLRRSQVDEVALADIDSCSVTVDSDSPIVTVSSAGTEWSFKLGYDRNNYVTDLVCQAVNGE